MFKILLLFILVWPLALRAQVLTLATNNGAITITGYTGILTTLNIPSSTNGYPVTCIGTNAFASSSLTSITIPDNITNIEASAFFDCKGVNTLNLGNGVTSIGNAAFYECISLYNINIPDSINSIGASAFASSGLHNISIGGGVTNLPESAFQDCGQLMSITVAPGNPSYRSAGGVLFDANKTTLIQFPTSIGGNYTIPNTVTNIGSSAFSGCGSLTNVNFGSEVVNIGQVAFYNCVGLTRVILPNSVRTIGFEAFLDCSRLTNIDLGTNLTSIGSSAFEECSALPNVIIPNTVTDIQDYAFQYDTALTEVTIPNSVTSFGLGVFYECFSLTNATISSGIGNFGYGEFYNCINLKTIYFAGNSPILSYAVFSGVNATAYYLPGTTGWATFDAASGLGPAVLWNPQAQTNDSSFGFHTNQFGFNITGTSGITIVVESCTNLLHPVWQPVQTNTLTSGSAYFSDPQWTNYPGRYYRFRSP